MNADDLFTRCPTCKTVFRTDDHHLSIQAGRVRCGQCRMVFDGRANLVEVAFDDVVADESPQTSPAASPPSVSPAMAAPTQTSTSTPTAPPSAATSQPVTPAAATSDSGAAPAVEALAVDADSIKQEIAAHESIAAGTQADSITISGVRYPEIAVDEPGMGNTLTTLPPGRNDPPTIARDSRDWPVDDNHEPTISRAIQAPAGPPSGDTVSRFAQPRTASDDARERTRNEHVVMPEWKGPVAPPRGRARWGYGLLAFLLFVVLAAQAVFQFRNVLAADFPVTRPHLANACAHIGCRIEPLRNRDQLVIESHDLQADPAHQGLLILQTTLRNQARHALAFPHLELQLDDNIGKPIVRRVFAPVEYAGGAADFSAGIPANAEWNVKLFLDGSGVSAGTYHLYHFYP